MNATMTYNSIALNPVHTRKHSFLSTLRRFLNALVMTNTETAYGLPANMAARLYL